nr:hypothetical protein SHINE37_40905 [Rhizobiaceae bacterium]
MPFEGMNNIPKSNSACTTAATLFGIPDIGPVDASMRLSVGNEMLAAFARSACEIPASARAAETCRPVI